jgi:acetylornithine deacetylase/succinyl-diaminopimelate desuccinylase-like protein
MTPPPSPSHLPIVVQLCQDLVRIPSVNPDDNPGTSETGEARCAEWLAKWIQREFPDAEVSTPEVLPNRPNIIARFPSDTPGKPRLLFAPHTDTVSVAGMTIPPFGGEIRQNRLFGRGASDTKGPMASMLSALRAVREHLPRLSHEIWFAGLAGEEAGQHGAHALASKESFALVIAAEPTGLDFVYTHKGSMFLTLSSSGVAVHAARPQDGQNAIYPMADVMRLVRDELSPWLATFQHPVLGHSTVSAGTIRGGSKTNVVPDFCQATLDIRTVPGQDTAFEKELFGRLRSVYPTLDIQVTRAHPLLTHLDHPLLDKLQALGSLPAGAPWFCDAAVFAKHGSPAIAMGPGSIAQAHTCDEWISIEDLEKGASFFESFLRELRVPS